jgi:hypothetical protein
MKQEIALFRKAAEHIIGGRAITQQAARWLCNTPSAPAGAPENKLSPAGASMRQPCGRSDAVCVSYSSGNRQIPGISGPTIEATG